MNDPEDLYQPLTMESMIKELKSISGVENKFYFRGRLTTYSITLNQPAETKEIATLEKQNNVVLPEDYKEFLLLANGVEFGNYEGRICSIEEVLGFSQAFSDYYPSNMFVIAVSEGASIHVILEVLSNRDYNLYTRPSIGDNRLTYFGNNILKFLDMFISTYGFPFWEWISDQDKCKVIMN